jgi:hypothetical protein
MRFVVDVDAHVMFARPRAQGDRVSDRFFSFHHGNHSNTDVCVV